VVYLNDDVGAKSRLLSAKLGTNPKADEEGDPTIREAMSELDSEFRTIKLAIKNLPQAMKETQNILDKYGIDVQRMDTNMTKMYKHYKSHLHSSNSRMVNLEQSVSNLQHTPRPQAQDGDFDFDHNMQEPNATLQVEVLKLRQEMEEMRHQCRNAQALGQDTPTSSLFPPTSFDEIKARLAAVEARETTGSCGKNRIIRII
jgi:chromosome segregation ATPase